MAREVRHIGVRVQGERDHEVRRLAFEPGANLRDILGTSSVRVRSACAGLGACGLCRVRIDEGTAGPPTEAEKLHLGEETVAARTRLACQVVPYGDLDVTVLEPASRSSWRAPASLRYRPAHPFRAAEGPPLAAAIDVGTTQITVAICSASDGSRLTARCGPNPQAQIGADVVARLDVAARHPRSALQLQSLALDAIGRALLGLSQEEGIPLSDVGRVRVVGNSAMLTILSGSRAEAVLNPAAWATGIECPVADASAIAERWHLSASTDIDFVQPLGGFVGSDLLAGVVHCRLMDAAEPTLLVDFGTNSEIALWDGDRLWATAAAGGPAFEATGVGCGVAAEPGAIHRLGRSADGDLRAEVIESLSPRGFCGSGLVDMLALLSESGEVDERGRPAREPLTVKVAGARFAVSKADIDALQRAKGAVAAGIEVLCRRACVSPDRIGTIHVAGAFGEHLDPMSALRIGLLPLVETSRVRLAGNSALQGALDLLLSGEAEAALNLARGRAKLVNLSLEEEFEDLFVDHLHVRPWRGEAST